MGGPLRVEEAGAERSLAVDGFSGRVHVEWDAEAAVTPLGQLAFFVAFVKQGGLFDALVADCPLEWTRPNAPAKRDVVGTLVLSILASHRRHAHITCLRSDGVSPDLLGMKRIVSEDAIRRHLSKIDESRGIAWLRRHLDDVVRPLLREPWILDVDTTIKPLYGHREGAVVSDNPKTPGRPSHACHSSMMAGTRLVLDVAAEPGNAHTSKHASPSPWALLDRLGREHWPMLLRGEAGWSGEANMSQAEREGLVYLFRLRMTAKVKRGVARLTGEGGWVDAGRGWGAGDGVAALGMEPAASGGGSAPAPARRCGRGGGERRRRSASPGFRRGCARGRSLGTRCAGDLAGGGSGDPGPAVAGPGRWGDPFRRDQEPLGLGRLHAP